MSLSKTREAESEKPLCLLPGWLALVRRREVLARRVELSGLEWWSGGESLRQGGGQWQAFIS